jgi:hypothetical protein
MYYNQHGYQLKRPVGNICLSGLFFQFTDTLQRNRQAASSRRTSETSASDKFNWRAMVSVGVPADAKGNT